MDSKGAIFQSRLAIAKARMEKGGDKGLTAAHKKKHSELGKGEVCPICHKLVLTPKGGEPVTTEKSSDDVEKKGRYTETKHRRNRGRFASKGGAKQKKSPVRPGVKVGPKLPNYKPRPGAKHIEEDEVPNTSPKGAKLVSFTRAGGGAGMAIYADGSAYDGAGWQPVGWERGGSKKKAAPKKKTRR